MPKKKTREGGNPAARPAAKRGKRADRASMISELFRMFPTKRYTIKSLAAASGGADRAGRHETEEIVRSMIEQGTVQSVGSDKYRLGEGSHEALEGIVDMFANGSAYIKVEGREQDIYVNPRSTGQALNGDRVKFIITRSSRGGVPEGEIVSVIERSAKNYVGVLDMVPEHRYGFVRVDSRKVPVDIFVHFDTERPELNGQKVLVRITDWAQGAKNPTGEIVDVFGKAGDNEAEMHSILAEYDLPYKFKPEVEKDAESISGKITKKDYAERRDMRAVTTFTIDPADAKDFDDALSVRRVSDGVWEVGVHIADVTHYVTPGMAVELEAENRATSVYLVDRTVPMLPERLSNELCSLRPNEEKLTFSAVFELDDKANILKEWFGRTVIYSDRRFSYDEAQQIIETGEGDLCEEILTLNRLAQAMRAQNFKNGSIAFDREEAKFTLDPMGKPLGVYFKVQKESNQLIEEFMLLANRKVAEFIGKKRGAGANAERTFVYRVHDEPNVDKLASFRRFITRFGYDFRAETPKKVAKEMNKLMVAIKDKPEENIVSTLGIRTMAKAYYSTDNIGHYGLAFDYYTHFTSPIRRYPDIMVHRLLTHYLAGCESPDKSAYEALCEHASEMEIRAAEAERASIKYKMVEFMLDRIGEEFDGCISGITEWGIYVELEATHIEGMVSLRDMTDDFYDFDEENYAVVGRSSGRKFTLGEKVRIKVLRADLARKQLDFEVTASYEFGSAAAVPLTGSRPPEQGRTAGRYAKPAAGKGKPESGRSKNKENAPYYESLPSKRGRKSKK